MGQLKVNALRQYVPDEGNYLSKLPKDWTGDDVRNHFSNSLPMVSCWCCLAAEILSKLKSTFENAVPRDLRRLCAQLLKDNDGIAPNVQTLAETMTTMTTMTPRSASAGS